jgi:hypothetical protein
MTECAEMRLATSRANREALEVFNYDALIKYDTEINFGARERIHGTLRDLEKAKEKSRVAMSVYGIMMYCGSGWIRIQTQESSGCRLGGITDILSRAPHWRPSKMTPA